MDNIILLSEIHPKGVAILLDHYGQSNMSGECSIEQSRLSMILLFHPIVQAKYWHGLPLKAAESDLKLRPEEEEFLAYIEEIYDVVNGNHQFLVIRDWCHLDYTGVPFCEPTHVNYLNQLLIQKFSLNEVYLIRHPIDCLISIAKKIPIDKTSGQQVDLETYLKIYLEAYLDGYLCYIQSAPVGQLIKYEDFVDAPDVTLRRITHMLGIPYDQMWTTKWKQYSKVTGDTPTILTSQGDQEVAIKPRPRSPVDVKILQAFERSSTYQEILALSGYGHPF